MPTIGQPDAGGPMTGGNYSHTGGFWSLFAVQSPGAPLLSIERISGAVRVFWPKASAGFLLDEGCASLDPENLRGALRCVLNHTPTLLAIAHP